MVIVVMRPILHIYVGLSYPKASSFMLMGVNCTSTLKTRNPDLHGGPILLVRACRMLKWVIAGLLYLSGNHQVNTQAN